MRSDAAIQPAAVEQTLRIEHFLDLPHHRKIISRLRPKLVRLAKTLRRKFHNAGPSRWQAQVGGSFEISVANARPCARHSPSRQELQNAPHIGEHTRNSHYRAVF